MGYNNGYDSGYSDALEDVRSGKVAGFGPAGGGAGAAPSYLRNADTSRYAEIDGNTRAVYSAPSSVTAAYGAGALDFQVPQGVPAGTVMNLSTGYQILDPVGETEEWNDVDLFNAGIDGTVTVNGSAILGLDQLDEMAYGYHSLVLWFDGESWVCVAHDDNMP